MRLKVTLVTLVLVGIMVWSAVFSLPDNNLHVYFCDVGQGDAALIVYGTTEILIDTGPDASVLNCLSDHMPFFDKQIETVILTHPQQDHMGGFTYIAESYRVMHLFIPPADNPIRVYKKLQENYLHKEITVSNLFAGDKLKLGEIYFQSIWPTRDFVAGHTVDWGSKVLGVQTDGTDLNGFSIVGILSLKDFDILFTGDADAPVELAQISTGLLRQVEVLKVPHHGSKTGMTGDWLSLSKPQLSVISVGKNNRYGHPAQKALEMLQDVGTHVLRTDQSGTIEVVSDGNDWWVAD